MAQTYTQGQLPADIFNSTSGDVKDFNGSKVRVTVNNNGTRTLDPVAASMPQNSQQVQEHLNEYHNLVLQATSKLKEPEMSDADRLDQVKARILPSSPLPIAPNMLQTYASLRADPNITSLETNLSKLKEQETTIQNNQEATQAVEEGKTVATNVIAGREGEEDRQARIQLDSISRRKSVLVDELNTRYHMIDTIMQFTQQDYDNAYKTWQTEFTTNQAIYDAFTSDKRYDDQTRQQALQTAINAAGQEVGWAMQEQQFEYQQQQDTIRNATANLTLYANMLKDGNTKYDNLSAEQKMQVQKLEVQSGLGSGFLQNLRADNPDGKVIYAGANGAVLQMTDGSLKTVNYNVSGKSGDGGGKVSPAKKLSDAITEMRPVVTGALNKDNDISPQDWQKLLSQWENAPDANLTKDQFIKEFGQYADTNRGDFYNQYGFKNPVPPKKEATKKDPFSRK